MADILLIEDDEMLLKAQTRFLEKEGFTVHACENGKVGLEQLDQHSFDLVITDLNMPVADGFEVVTSIRAQEKHKDLPVMVVTSMASPSVIKRCLRMGANDFVPKPVVPNELRNRIQRLLGSFA